MVYCIEKAVRFIRAEISNPARTALFHIEEGRPIRLIESVARGRFTGPLITAPKRIREIPIGSTLLYADTDTET